LREKPAEVSESLIYANLLGVEGHDWDEPVEQFFRCVIVAEAQEFVAALNADSAHLISCVDDDARGERGYGIGGVEDFDCRARRTTPPLEQATIRATETSTMSRLSRFMLAIEAGVRGGLQGAVPRERWPFGPTFRYLG
jgi:hypothetical protein